MDLFDILGPVMVGPSSSHTAGAVRIGRIARRLLGEGTPAKAHITLYGSFAATGRGHGTDRALIAGLMGWDTDDERIADSFALARAAGMDFTFEYSRQGAEHPNTASLLLTAKNGKTLSITAASLGGGRITVLEMDGLRVRFTGDLPTLIVQNTDHPGTVGRIATTLAAHDVNIATMELSRDHPGGHAVMILETDKPVPELAIKLLRRESGITGITCIAGEGAEKHGHSHA